MKITLAQQNYIIGDIEGNARKIVSACKSAEQEGADLILFPELSICGYPPLDLLERRTFVDRCIDAIHGIAAAVSTELGVLVGGPEINPNEEGKPLYNSAWFLHKGAVQQTFRKALLPTYDVFDEYRYFEPNDSFSLLRFNGEKIAITICEDLWDDQPLDDRFHNKRLYKTRPLDQMLSGEPTLVVNIAASPYSSKRQEIKHNIFIDKAQKHQLPVAMISQVGANTELVFEGGSLVISPTGEVMQQLTQFGEDQFTFELDRLREFESSKPFELTDRIAMIHDALVCGVRDYFNKSGFNKATLGLSGGIDSAVTLAIAHEALGNEALYVLLMPSPYSSDHSITDSVEMAENLGIKYQIINISDLFDDYREALKPVFGERPEDLAEENIQSRIRGTLLMALSNKLGHILLNTSNKSETAVGYGTLYGDMAGGLSVIGDVYKLDVYALARYINRNHELIPENIITKPPSAELRPDQKDSDSLPEYEILDQILELYIEKQYDTEEIVKQGYELTLVNRILQLVDRNEYKRYQTPPILRISSKAFGVGRRIPIVRR